MPKQRPFEVSLSQLQARDRESRVGMVAVQRGTNSTFNRSNQVVALSPVARQQLARLAQLGLTAGTTTQQAGIVELWNQAVEAVKAIVREGGGDPDMSLTGPSDPQPGDSAAEPGVYDTI